MIYEITYKKDITAPTKIIKMFKSKINAMNYLKHKSIDYLKQYTPVTSDNLIWNSHYRSYSAPDPMDTDPDSNFDSPYSYKVVSLAD